MTTESDIALKIQQFLAYQSAMGAESFLAAQGQNRFGKVDAGSATAQVETNKPAVATTAASAPARLGRTPDVVAHAQALAARANTVEELRATVEDFDGCPLKETAINTVFADGVPDSGLMFLGEAPGSDEDRSGKPFVGPTGQFLDVMLGHIGVSRSSNAYLSNVVSWRPPGNRRPNPVELASCLPFTRRHIELVRPRVLVLLGGLALQNLIDPSLKITRARGTWMRYELADGTTVPVLPMLHPAYLARVPLAKSETWRDLLSLKAKLRELGHKLD